MDNANEISELRQRLQHLEATAAQRLTPQELEAARVEAERREYFAQVEQANAERWGPIRYVDPMAGEREDLRTVIQDKPKVTVEDRGYARVFVES